MSEDLEGVAATLVADGKGILAADETLPILTKRFDTLGIPSTEQCRRTYRAMLFTAPGAAEFVSGAIGIIPGIKVDTGAKSLAGSPDERVTEGPDRRVRAQARSVAGSNSAPIL
jgi:fructose-bisphosphate aldolase, class I